MPPKVFLSYSHDSEPHKQWVELLAKDLVAKGIDVILDQWGLRFGQDTVSFMTQGITESDRVLIVCTEKYVGKADNRSGGVAFEGLIITGELVGNIDTHKFVPLMRDNEKRSMPKYLGARLYVDFCDNGKYGQTLESLARDIHGQPAHVKPPIGQNPFSGTPTESASTKRLAGSTGRTAAGAPVLDDEWFTKSKDKAGAGLQQVGLTGAMELRFALHEAVSKSQLELLNAVRSSEVHTFGWPIAVTLENREEFRPRPTEEGIVAEISSALGELSDKKSYDYWTARNNGDFYLLQGLFEDSRAEMAIFADTRIVRITESLMFLHSYYRALGVSDDTKFSLRVRHHGLANRMLTVASPRRFMIETKSTADASQSELSDSVGNVMPRIVDHVIQLAGPLFMLFNFKQLERKVYEEIVGNFVDGRII